MLSPSVAGQAAKKSAPQKQAARPDPNLQVLLDAEAALDRKDYAAAAELYGKYLAAIPSDAFAHFQLGYSFTALRRHEEAQAEYRKAIELDPKMGPGYLNLGILLLEKDPAGAVPVLLKAVELIPSQARPLYLAGTALERSGNRAAAAEQYRKALAIEKSNWDCQIALARVLLSAQQAPEAEGEFRKALELRPDFAPARLGLAQSLLAQQKFPDAAKELEKYLESQPRDRETRFQLAGVYAELERNDDALRELDRIGAVDDPGLQDPVERLRAELFMRQKRYAEAAGPLRRLVAAHPQDGPLHARLGHALLEQRDYASAEAELTTALRIDTRLTDAMHDLLSAYFLAENYPAALAVMDQLAQREAPVPATWFVRAICYDKLRRKQEALDAYQKFLALDQGHDPDRNFQARQRVRILTRELKR